MKRSAGSSGSRARLTLGVGVVAIVALAAGFLFLKRIPPPVDIPFLRDRDPIESRLRTAALRSDVYEPFEYTVYNWRQSYGDSQSQLTKELKSEGFTVVSKTASTCLWGRDDVEVSVQPRRVMTAAVVSPDAVIIHDQDWTLVVVTRRLEYSLLTQLRVWLFDVRQD